MIRALALCTALALPAAAALPASAFAQTAPAESPALLSLSATGEVSLTPDQARTTAGVVTRGDTAAEAVRANAQAMNRVFAALRRAGIAERDLQTANLSVNPVYARPDRDSDNSEARITGYEARNEVSALVRDISDIGAVIDAMFEAGANTLQGVQFLSSEAEGARDEARRRAVAELMALRDLYAEAAGFTIVGLESFTESGGMRPQIVMTAARMESMDMRTPVAPGELTVRVQVSASWEIEG
ncbi:MAG: SIMPL domain-containing protein [Oceanicaulis sp.]